MARQWWMALLLVCWVGAAVAGGSGRAEVRKQVDEVRKQIEFTMLVDGTIDLDAQGQVDRYTIARQETLPPGILAMFARVVPQWRFEPVQVAGKVIPTQESMTLRLVARKLDNGNLSVAIRGAHFGQTQPGEFVSSTKLTPPSYPQVAANSGVGGTAYLVLKIARNGRVEEAIAEQVNLRIVASEPDMARWRKMFADSALKAAKRWTFVPPTAGEEVDAPFWSARVPVEFIAPEGRRVKDHEWHAYVPGPRQPIPWRDNSNRSTAADALGAGGVYPLNAGLRLLTALDPG